MVDRQFEPTKAVRYGFFWSHCSDTLSSSDVFFRLNTLSCPTWTCDVNFRYGRWVWMSGTNRPKVARRDFLRASRLNMLSLSATPMTGFHRWSSPKIDGFVVYVKKGSSFLRVLLGVYRSLGYWLGDGMLNRDLPKGYLNKKRMDIKKMMSRTSLLVKWWCLEVEWSVLNGRILQWSFRWRL